MRQIVSGATLALLASSRVPSHIHQVNIGGQPFNVSGLSLLALNETSYGIEMGRS
jgi:hypothetical protein